jgi:hypothetical protein
VPIRGVDFSFEAGTYFTADATNPGSVNGDNAVVTDAEVRQTQNVCFYAGGDNQMWTNATCQQVTGTDGDDYGLYAGGIGSTFTNVTIGDTYASCFYADNSDQVFTTIKCHSSNGGVGIYVNDNDVP